MNPLGPFFTHLRTVYMACSECLPTCVNPRAERACFSQGIKRNIISNPYLALSFTVKDTGYGAKLLLPGSLFAVEVPFTGLPEPLFAY